MMDTPDRNPMEVSDPDGKPGAKPGTKRCGAKLRKKPGKRCRSDKLMPNGRCRLHGGKTPSGPMGPNWKHGRRSKNHRWQADLPKTSLAKRFNVALADPQLTSLRAAAALNDAMLTSYTASLSDTGKPLTLKQQDRVHKLMEVQGRLAEREARRLRDLAAGVSDTQFAIYTRTITELFIEYVTDVKARLEISRRINQAMLTVGRQDERGDE